MHFDVTQVGELSGRPVNEITLENRNGIKASVLTYGCILRSMLVPDRDGNVEDVVLGYGGFEPYLAGHPFFGAIAGRFANRIAKGRFSLGGKDYTLDCNEAPTGSHLHGGKEGFDKAVWGFGIEEGPDALRLNLYHSSPDGDQGYPGRLDVVHTISLDEENRVGFDFRAVADADTVLNLVNHSYWNLSGTEGATVEEHEMCLDATHYLPVDETMLPLGEVRPVERTEFDFRKAQRLAPAMDRRSGRDFDHCFILGTADADGMRQAADLYHPGSGRGMEVTTTQPSVQFYNGFKLANREWYGRGGTRYPAFAGLCLETQHFPDSPNRPHFPTTALRAGQLWEQRTLHRFYTREA